MFFVWKTNHWKPKPMMHGQFWLIPFALRITTTSQKFSPHPPKLFSPHNTAFHAVIFFIPFKNRPWHPKESPVPLDWPSCINWLLFPFALPLPSCHFSSFVFSPASSKCFLTNPFNHASYRQSPSRAHRHTMGQNRKKQGRIHGPRCA